MNKHLPSLLLTLLLQSSVYADTFVVTNTLDWDPNSQPPIPGSFRQAILDADFDSGADTISFDIPGAGVKTISPIVSLPAIIYPVTIDGYTQPAAASTPWPWATTRTY